MRRVYFSNGWNSIELKQQIQSNSCQTILKDLLFHFAIDYRRALIYHCFCSTSRYKNGSFEGQISAYASVGMWLLRHSGSKAALLCIWCSAAHGSVGGRAETKQEVRKNKTVLVEPSPRNSQVAVK